MGMNIKKSLLLAIVFVAFLAQGALATTYYVGTTSCSDAYTTTQAQNSSAPWCTIQHAANTVVAGDTVLVENGTYVQTVVVTRGGSSGSPIKFKSQNKWGAVIAPTAGNSNNHILDVTANYVTVQDFEITGTNNSSGNIADGIKTYNNYTDENVIGNKIHNLGNSVCESGAGIESGGNHSLITGNYIYLIGLPWSSNPTCAHNHGIYGVGSEAGAYFANNIIFQIFQGFAFHFNDAAISNITVTNNTIFNVGDEGYGGAIIFSCQSGTCDYLTFSNNLIADTLLDTTLAYGCFNETLAGGTGTFGSHNTFANNVVDTTCRLGQDLWLNGNSDSNTKQVSNVGFVNYTGENTGDYHLQSTSPAIDYGTQSVGLTNLLSGSWSLNTSNGSSTYAPLYDYAGITRPQGAGYDVGAYEFVTASVPSPPTGLAATVQ
jgi:hypothetical protein